MSNTAISSEAPLFKTFRECLFSFTFDLVGLLAGILLASQLHIFKFSPWVVAVYPAILSAKGMIGGMFIGRLSTALHVGTIYPRVFGNTKSFYKLFGEVAVITLITSLFMSLIAILFGISFWGIEVSDFLNIALTVTATMALGLTITLVTISVSFITFKRGFDPDVVVYPIMSTTADIGITLYYIIIVALFFSPIYVGKILIIIINIFYLLLVFSILRNNIHDEEFMKNVREIFLTLIIVTLIVNLTGTFLRGITFIVEERKEIYMVYPALIDMIGDVGSVIGSMTTTRLALGLLNPSLSAIRKVKGQISSSWLASIIIFVTLSFLSLLLNGIFEFSTFISFTYILLMVNLIAVPLITMVSYAVAILTFKKGLDPDNFTIPIESSLADNITTIALLIVLLH